MTEWTPLNKEDYMKIEYIAFFIERCSQVNGKLLAWFGKDAELADVDYSQGIRTLPLVDYVNGIEENLRRLSERGYRPADMKPCKVWKGEEADLERLDYRDVNRWFESLDQLEKLLEGLNKRIRKTGTYSAGYYGVRQNVRLAQ